MKNKITPITFPTFTGKRCLMLPFIQGEPQSVPEQFRSGYEGVLSSVYFKRGDIGFLTIDESPVKAGAPHRGDRAEHGRALHTEAGITPFTRQARWGGGGWGGNDNVLLDSDTRILLSSNVDDSCAIWDATHLNTSSDGDIGHLAEDYPYDEAKLLKAGEVENIGIFTPHESLPVPADIDRQFLRIISSGVTGREDHFTANPMVVAPSL